ncbi:MAG: hypothetical protein ACI9N0_002100 [Ilumatobacter sp.]
MAYALEQCWDPIPGQAATAALGIAAVLRGRPADVTILQVVGKHADVPPAAYRPVGSVAMLPLGRRWLYEAWARLNWPKVESVTGTVDVAHATGFVPCGTSVPLVVTISDIQFLDELGSLSKHLDRMMRRSFDVIRERADRVLCSSASTFDDCVRAGLDEAKLRLVPVGADADWKSAAEQTLAVYRELVPAGGGAADS